MSRMPIASSWLLISLGICSCAQETDAPLNPAPVAKRSAVPEPSDPAPVQQQEIVEKETKETDDPFLAKPIPVPEAEPEPEPTPSSGNPLIDFFRSVDRGVKSTTPNSNEPAPDPSSKPRDE